MTYITKKTKTKTHTHTMRNGVNRRRMLLMIWTRRIRQPHTNNARTTNITNHMKDATTAHNTNHTSSTPHSNKAKHTTRLRRLQ